MALKEKDFIEITYTGTLTETGDVFDTSDEQTAKKHHIHRDSAEYGAIVICLGQGQLLKGLEKELLGKNQGTHHVNLTADHAFGKKHSKLITMIPTKKFLEQKINPVPNLRINIDGMVGIVKSVGGGRTLVDFNHLLAGKDVSYDVTITRIVTDLKEQIAAMLKVLLGLQNPAVSVDKDAVTIEVPAKFPDQLKGMLSEKLTSVTAAKNIQFKEAKPLNTTVSKNNEGA